MSSTASGKPRIANEIVLALLREQVGAPIEDLAIVAGGQVAQTYAFTAHGMRYIVRFAQHMLTNLDKERFIQGLLASSNVPIPPILYVGRLGELHYAISRRMPGRPLTELSPDEYEATIPALTRTLDALHAVDVGATSGYGIFSDDGAGLYRSWRRYLAAIREEDPEWDFYGKWHSLFETTFLERDVWEAVYARMVALLDSCPEDRHLVHGNYGFGNALAEDGRITAVLDWVDAKYGDFLYDVAWLDFWSPDRDFRALFAARYTDRGVETPNYGERILCYECYIALDALRFFAKRESEESYCWARERIQPLLG
jgi:hygromycin-B 4-O-kinase